MVEMLQMKVSKHFRIFYTLPHGYKELIATTILSEIDRAPYQIVYHSQPLILHVTYDKVWEYCRGPVTAGLDDITMP